jgi:membrane-associated phospholipid phosphatase
MANRRKPGSPQPRAWPRGLQVVLGVLAVVLLGYLAVFSYHFAQIQLGPFAPLAAILTLALLLAVLVPPLLVRYHRPLRAALAWVIQRLGALLAATRLPQRFAHRFPRFSRWLVARFTPGRPAGLALTAWVAGALLFLEQVIELFLEVASGGPVPALDRRIENLVALIRSPELDHLFYAVTWLGSLRVVGVLAIAGALLALVARRRRDALLLLLVTAGSWLSAQGLQLVVARPRPPLADARVLETSFSFPSSHATLSAAFYGAAAYFLIRALRRDVAKIIVGMLAGVLVLFVGVSRAYLGVHFPSDVLAGWMLGALWLAVMVIADRLWQARSGGGIPAAGSPGRPRPLGAVRRTLGTVDLLVAVGYTAAFVGISTGMLPSPPQPSVVQPVVIAPDVVPQTVEQQLPHYTEGLTGVPQEPVSFVFVGTQAQLEVAFRAAGWTEAQRFSFRAVTDGVEAVLTHHSDPAGPVTPSFLAEQPNTLAFSLPVGATFAERHHIRLWLTGVQTSTGQPLWLATASFDKGFELAPSTGLPTHQIDPNIDAERTFVVASLQGSGLVHQTKTIQLVPPESGRNFDGDPFHTDGQAVILYLAG